jgi:RNA polymerase sigma-70 factor, ECF subfamily
VELALRHPGVALADWTRRTAPAVSPAHDTDLGLDAFLREVGPRALVMARVALRDPDEAMDVVQDAMCRLVAKYAHRPEAEWRPLFFRILQHRIRDWHRRRAVRVRVLGWVGRGPDPDLGDPLEMVPDPRAQAPSDGVRLARAGDALRAALAGLPARQQQAFLLRAWEELNVAETAAAMGCSEGSVKTHYFRAIRALRAVLEEHRP